MGKVSMKLFILILFVLMVLGICMRLQAQEGGVGHYAPGAIASFVDVLPSSPSFAAFNYYTYYNGNANNDHQFPLGGQVASQVEATANADTVGGFWITPVKFLGGRFAPGISVPFVKMDVTAQVTLPSGKTAKKVTL